MIITLIDYVYEDCPKYAKYLIVFFPALILAFAYRIIADFFNKKIEERNKKKKEEEEEKQKEKEKGNEKIEIKEENQDEMTGKETEDRNNRILEKEN